MTEDGMSPELQEEHVRVLERWRDSLARARAVEPVPQARKRGQTEE